MTPGVYSSLEGYAVYRLQNGPGRRRRDGGPSSEPREPRNLTTQLQGAIEQQQSTKRDEKAHELRKVNGDPSVAFGVLGETGAVICFVSSRMDEGCDDGQNEPSSKSPPVSAKVFRSDPSICARDWSLVPGLVIGPPRATARVTNHAR